MLTGTRYILHKEGDAQRTSGSVRIPEFGRTIFIPLYFKIKLQGAAIRSINLCGILS